MQQRKIRMFIASAGELEGDRKEIKLFINQRNDQLEKQGLFIKTVDWKDLSQSLQKDRIQETFNKSMLECEIVVILFHKKIGEFTREEFDVAYKSLRTGKKPYSLYVYFKGFDLSSDELDDEKFMAELQEITQLKKYIQQFEQVYGSYRGIDELTSHFGRQLEIIVEGLPAEDIVDVVRQRVDERQILKGFDLKLHIHSKIPNRDPRFTGRRETVTELLKRLKNRDMVVVTGIFGMGGVGKTALVTEVCQLFKCTWENAPTFYSGNEERNGEIAAILGGQRWFGDGILWVKFEKDQSWGKLLSEQVFQQLGLVMEREEDAEVLLIEALHKKEILLVLDSAEQNEENFKDLYKLFHSYPRLVTSRRHFGVGEPFDLECMQQEEAVTLFLSHLGRSLKEGEREKAVFLCGKMGNLPLAIKILAIRGNRFNKNLQQLHDEFDQMKGRISQEFDEGGDIVNLNAFAAFSLSYDDLLEPQQVLFVKAGTFAYPFTVTALQGISGKENIMPELEKLVEYSLVSVESGEGETLLYSLHPLLREFALDKLKGCEFHDETYALRKSYFLEVAKSRSQIKLHLEEILAVMNWCRERQEEDFLDYVSALNFWLHKQGLWERCIELNEAAIAIARKLGDREREIEFLNFLADIMGRQGKNDDAEQRFRTCLIHYEETQNFSKILWIHYSFDFLEYKKNNHQQSFSASLLHSRHALFQQDEYRYGSFIKTCCWICRSFSRFALEEGFATANLMIKSSQRNNDVIKALFDCINFFFSVGRYEKALNSIAALRKSAAILCGKEDDQEFHSIAASVLRKCGRFDSAREELHQSMQLAFELGSEIDRKEAYLEEGIIALLEGRLGDAGDAFSRTNEDEGQDFWRGRLLLKQGNITKAKKLLKKAAGVHAGRGNIAEEAQVQVSLAEIALAEGNPDPAIQLLCEAKNTLRSFGILDLQDVEMVQELIVADIGEEQFQKKAQHCSSTILTTNNDDFFLTDLPRRIRGKDGREMVLIPWGTSFFGEGKREARGFEDILNNVEGVLDGSLFEGLAKARFLYPFYIDIHPVTRKEFANYCRKSEQELPEGLESLKETEENLPMTNITLAEAMAYASWTKKEIPLPDEWEKAILTEEVASLAGQELSLETALLEDNELKRDFDYYWEMFHCPAENDEEFNRWVDSDAIKEEGMIDSRIAVFPKGCVINKGHFISLLMNSTSLYIEEKEKLLDSLSIVGLNQIDELARILKEEFSKAKESNDTFMDIQKQRKGKEQLLLKRLVGETASAEQDRYSFSCNSFGVCGNFAKVSEITGVQAGLIPMGGVELKAKENSETLAQFIFNDGALKADFRHPDLGFRCVKPIFSMDDLKGWEIIDE